VQLDAVPPHGHHALVRRTRDARLDVVHRPRPGCHRICMYIYVCVGQSVSQCVMQSVSAYTCMTMQW
jgi:hypothetical protein